MTTNQTISPFATVNVAGGSVNVWGTPQKPYFRAKDISLALGLTRVSAYYKQVDATEVKTMRIRSAPRPCIFLTEKGAYQLISMIMPNHANRLSTAMKKEVRNAISAAEPVTQDNDLFSAPAAAEDAALVATPTEVKDALTDAEIKVENIVLCDEMGKMYALIDTLKSSSKEVANIFHLIYGDNFDMEDNQGFLAIQTSLNEAITGACTEIAAYIYEKVITA